MQLNMERTFWLVLAVVLAACSSEKDKEMHMTGQSGQPVIIAHRGASGYLPEHTLSSYARAIELGADFIEPDLVMTKDGELVARHDRYLGTTTDVADHPEFTDRRVVKPGHEGADWFVEDFTLAELKTLRAKQPFPGRSSQYDGQFEIPTFREILELRQRKSVELNRDIGVYPETKHPGYFQSIGLDFEKPLLSILQEYGLLQKGAPIIVQSFEPYILMRLKVKTDLVLMQLLTPDADGEPNISLEMIASYAHGIGPLKDMLRNPQTGDSTGVIEQAHALGLFVHPWTFRDDMVGKGFENSTEEMKAYFALGVDGLFSDFTDTAVAARNTMTEGQ